MLGNPTTPRRPRLTRSLAAALGTVLIFASVAPPFALAESDREGEGSAPPGAIPPGLEEGPGFEPGGEETSLEATPIAPGEELVEEVVAPVPEEGEPAPPPVGASPAAAEPAATAEAAPPVVTGTESPPEAAAPAPVYGTEASAPSYQTAPASAAPVENEAIVEPGAGGASAQRPDRSRPKAAPSPQVQVPPAEGPSPAPVEPPEPAVAPAAPSGHRPGTLNGRGSYTVVEGDDLWTIAEGVLPAGATNAEISAEVSRLWHLNSRAIGTGDPNVILVGTVLRLP